jgi:putative hydrolase of HD superfamily
MLRQIEFLIEVDRLKNVLRRSYLMDESRRENSAEHSWHLAVAGLILAEHADEPIDVCRVLRMAVIHDLVEIDAGDTYIYDTAGAADKAVREREAAERIFGILPADQAAELRALWDEFEAVATPEARYAAALDRLIPLLHNFHTQGRSWQEHGIVAERVYARNAVIANGSEALWEFARSIIDEAVARGYLPTA